MKLSIHTSELADHLYRVQGIASSKTTMPSLAHVLLNATKDGVMLSATDMDLAIEDKVPNANVATPGTIALPAKSLFEVVKALPAGEMSLELQENNRVEVKAQRTSFKLVGLSASEFPALPAAKIGAWNDIGAKDLARMIDCTIFCVSLDDARYNLTGVYWEPYDDGKMLRFVATDGHRLAMIERSLTEPAGFKPVIVPRKTLGELKRIIGSASAEEGVVVRCGFSDNHAVFQVGEVTLTSRLVDGQFPDYEQVIPKAGTKIVKVARQELTDALKRVSLLSPDKSFGVRLDVSAGQLHIESQNPVLGEAKQEVEIEYQGEPVSVGFNAHYILDVLALIGEGGVRVELSDALSPALIRPLEARDFSAVVMPMRV